MHPGIDVKEILFSSLRMVLPRKIGSAAIKNVLHTELTSAYIIKM